MKSKRKREVPAWKEFFDTAGDRIVRAAGAGAKTHDPRSWAEKVAAEIVAIGEGPAFLKAVRRGRPTARQNLRYQLLREVERLAGGEVKRRRVDSNTPDALALKSPGTLELRSV